MKTKIKKEVRAGGEMKGNMKSNLTNRPGNLEAPGLVYAYVVRGMAPGLKEL